MSELNVLRNIQYSGNSGVPAQTLEPENIVGAILCDPSFSISVANLASNTTLKAALAAATLVIGSGRIFPLAALDNPTDNSEASKKSKTAYGRTQFGDEGGYDHSFEIVEGGMELHKNLRKFNDRQMYFMYIDKKNRIFGWKDSAGIMYPFSGDVRFEPFKIHNGTDKAKFMVNFVMDNVTEINDNLGFFACDFDVLKTIKGLVDVTIVETAHSATTATVKVTSAYGCIDMAKDFETILETAANWRLYPVAGGADVVPSGIVYTAATGTDTIGTFVITHASLSASHYLSLDTPAVLAAAGMGGVGHVGYESNTITVAYT
jgi:hypothetical protein